MSIFSSGSLGSIGSFSKTSMPAPAIHFCLQCLHQRRLIDDRPARSIDDKSRRLHHFEFIFPDDMESLLPEQRVAGNIVRFPHHFRQAFQGNAGFLRQLRVDMRVIADDFHAETLCFPGDNPADMPAPDDAERLSGDGTHRNVSGYKLAFQPSFFSVLLCCISFRATSAASPSHGWRLLHNRNRGHSPPAHGYR